MSLALRSLGPALAVPAAALLAFELWFAATGRVSDTIAPPSQAFWRLAAGLADGSIVAMTVETLAATLAGLAVGGGLGLAAGSVLALTRRADMTARYVVEMLRAIPSIALLPLALLIFGFGYRMEIFVVAFATFWPVLILSHSAVLAVEPRLIDVSRMLGFGPLSTLSKLVLPAAAPRLATALRLASGIALVVAVTCEITANPQGLGNGLMRAQESLQPALMWAVLLWIGVIGYTANRALLAMERRLFAHRSDVDTSVAA